MATIGLRCTQEFIQKIDAYRRDEPDLPSRAEALRRLAIAALPRNRRRPAHLRTESKLGPLRDRTGDSSMSDQPLTEMDSAIEKQISYIADIKAAANSSMPVPPIGTNRDRVGLVGSGNPNVLEEAASAKPYGRAKDGPAWREGLRNAAQPMNLSGNSNRRNMRSRRPVTN